MTSYFSDGIKHETATADDKREGTCIIIIFLNFASNVLIKVFS